MRLREIYNSKRTSNKTIQPTILTDLGMTYGSIVEDFSIWIKNDLKKICDIKHTYIESEFTGMKEFYFTEAMIASVAKPNLSLTFNLDLISQNEYFNSNAFRAFEATASYRHEHYTDNIIFADTDEGNIEVRLSYKPIKVILTAGIVAESRYHAQNILQAWMTRRVDNHVYGSGFYVDFQIPKYIIETIYDRFNISRKSHRPMLAWLNKHCDLPVFYGVNTFNGESHFYVKYKTKPIIKVLSSNPPQGVVEGNSGLAEQWVFTREFELSIITPSMIMVTDHQHPEMQAKTNNDINKDIVSVLKNERLAEYSLQIEDKHAITSFDMKLKEDDIIHTTSGKTISKKIDISELLSHDDLMIEFRKWAYQKGLIDSDLFEFVVYKRLITNKGEDVPFTRLGKGHTLTEAIDKLGLKTEEAYRRFVEVNKLLLSTDDGRLLTVDDIDISNDNMEYDYYIKNTRDFWFIDLEPNLDNEYIITLYVSIRLYNQFMIETGYRNEGMIYGDDMAHEYAQGRFQNFNDNKTSLN